MFVNETKYDPRFFQSLWPCRSLPMFRKKFIPTFSGSSSPSFLGGPSAYAFWSTSALWLIVPSPYWTFQLSPPGRATSFGFFKPSSGPYILRVKVKYLKCWMRQITNCTFQGREWDPILQSCLRPFEYILKQQYNRSYIIYSYYG
jgi:hypothetical protein